MRIRYALLLFVIFMISGSLQAQPLSGDGSPFTEYRGVDSDYGLIQNAWFPTFNHLNKWDVWGWIGTGATCLPPVNGGQHVGGQIRFFLGCDFFHAGFVEGSMWWDYPTWNFLIDGKLQSRNALY